MIGIGKSTRTQPHEEGLLPDAAPLSQCKNYSLGTRRKAGIEYPPFCTGCHLSRDVSRSASCRLLALRNCTHQRLPAWRRFRRPPWGLTPSFHPSPGRWARWVTSTAPTSPAGLLSVALGLVATLRSRRPTLLFRWVSVPAREERRVSGSSSSASPRQRHLELFRRRSPRPESDR